MKTYYFQLFFRCILLLVVLGGNLDSIAQNVSLETQADVDAFDPSTTVINGSLKIGVDDGSSNITNLSTLTNIINIEKSIRICNNDNLMNIDELNNLTSIGGDLYIKNNYNLTNIDAFANIDSLRQLKISDNHNLINIQGLTNLTAVEREIDISRNNNLLSLAGLKSLKIADRIDIYWNEKLTNLNGLNNLISVYNHLSISNNKNLTSLEGLDNLEVTGNFYINRNDNLTSLEGLNNLTSVNYTLSITWNVNLKNLNGLIALTAIGEDIGFIALSITDNDNLLNIDGLSGVNLIGGTIWIDKNEKIENLDGLSSLVSVGESIHLYENPGLSNVDGLSNLLTVGEDIRIQDNDNLLSVEGLSNVITIGRHLIISFNKSLAYCCGIQSLLEDQTTSIGGNIDIKNTPLECKNEEVVLASNCAMKMKISATPPCFGEENGSIQIYLEKFDTIPFYYEWMRLEDGVSGNGISESKDFTIDFLGMGTYNITVTNDEPDTVIRNNIVLSQQDGYIFEVNEVKTINSSNGQSNGSITLTTSGGIAPYTYSWLGVESGSESGWSSDSYTIPLLLYGEYNITVEDDNGATKVVDVSLLDEFVEVIPCEKPLDIVILNDVSGSVDAIEYQESKQFFVDFLNNVNINMGDEDSKAAIIEWSSSNQQQVKIPITGNMANLSSYLDATRSFDNETAPHEAMKYGESYLDTNARPNVEKVLILSTDGTLEQIPSSLIALADRFKAKGYHIVTIAFDHAYSNNSTRDILRKIATIDALAPGAPSYSSLDADLAKNIVFNYLCPIDPGSSATAHFKRDGLIDIITINSIGNCLNPVFVEVDLEISAKRELSIPAGTPITFYQNNPYQFGSTAIFTWQIPCAIPVGITENYTVTLPVKGPTHIYAVLNDDGIQGAPISFPITEIEELAYSNNIDNERICIDSDATLQALKYSTLPMPACDTLVNYTINVCNISEVDAFGVTITDIAPAGFMLTGSIFNDNGCATNNVDTYDIPADCCLSLSLSYDAASADFGYYGDQNVDLDGPSNQIYIDFDGSTTTDEDVTIDGTIDCPSTNITFTKSANIDESCDDGFVEYTFTITNEMNIPIQGMVFRDVLQGPCTWAHAPYGESGLSIANSYVTGNETFFTIDEVQANTIATFYMDVSLNSWNSDGTLNNTATLENVPDLINGGYTTLTSNIVSTEVIASPKITHPDTIVVINSLDTVNLEALLSTFADVTWTTEGDGHFIDEASESTMYIFGTLDKLKGQVSLFISAISECNETGKAVVIKIEDPNSTKKNTDFELVKIYPNPFMNTFFIKSLIDFQSYEILDFNGKSVAEKRNIQSSSDIEIDMSHYPNGVYLLKLISNGGIQLAMVVKI